GQHVAVEKRQILNQGAGSKLRCCLPVLPRRRVVLERRDPGRRGHRPATVAPREDLPQSLLRLLQGAAHRLRVVDALPVLAAGVPAQAVGTVATLLDLALHLSPLPRAPRTRATSRPVLPLLSCQVSEHETSQIAGKRLVTDQPKEPRMFGL